MSAGDFGAVLDSEAFAQNQNQAPTLRKRTKNIVLLSTVNPANTRPIVRSIAISDAGIITAAPVDSLVMGTTAGRDMSLIHWLDDVFAVYNNDDWADSYIYTVTCDDAGAIPAAVTDSLKIGQSSNLTQRSGLLKVHDNVLLVGHCLPYATVHLQTVIISDAGIMGAAVTDSFVLPQQPRTQRLRQGAGNWIVDLSGLSATYYIATLTCSVAGALPPALTDEWGPIAAANERLSLCKVTDTVFAIFSKDNDNAARIHTFSINSDGTINKAWIDSETVEATLLHHLHMMELGGGYFVVAYNMAAPNWRLKTYFIADDGTIQAGAIDTLDRATGNRGNQWFEHLEGDIWTFTYEDSPGSVTIDTIEIEMAPTEGPHNELTLGIGP